MTEFQFERGELLSNLTLLEDHADKFQCPYCMEKHTSKIIGYAEEIAMGGEDVKMMKKLAEQAREWRRKVQGAKEHSHDNPRHLTACEKKIERCVVKLKDDPKIKNPYAVCRASIKCPP